MSNSLILVLALIARCSLAFGYTSMEPDWEYILLKSECTSSDLSVFNPDLRPVRVVPGVYAINGTFKLGAEIDDKYFLSANLFYSSGSGGPWTNTPYEYKACDFYTFMNTAYKLYLMEDLSACAGTPNLGKEEFKGPLKPNTYFVKNCLISNSNLPAHFRPGYYKLVANANGPLGDLVFELTVKVESKHR